MTARARAAASSLRRLAKVLGAPVGVLLSALLIWNLCHAAFFAQTSNSSNSFTAGTVSLSDDDINSALFTVSALKPGSTGTSCIKVTYGGSLAASVKLFVVSGDLTGTGLAPYLNIVIEEGNGGSFGTCTGFSTGATDYTGTLSAFATASTNMGTGVGSWAPTGAAQTKVYRFTYTMANNNAAQGLNSTVKFTWEADNT